jgi:hypothetical protein
MVHIGGRGVVSFSGPGKDGRWVDRLVPAQKAIAESAHLEGQTDVYISVAQFRRGGGRTAERVLTFGATAIELDQHNGRRCGADAMWNAARAVLLARKITLPAIVVESGRGIHLWWPYLRRIPAAAAPRWRATQSALVKNLLHLGADPSCVDAARVLRLPGTINSKTGTEARIIWWSDEHVDFEALFAAAVPISRNRLSSNKKRAAPRRSPTPRRRDTWQAAAVDEMRRVAGIRGAFRAGVERNTAVHIAASLLSQIYTGDAYAGAVFGFARDTTNLSAKEVQTIHDSAMKKRRQDGRGYLYSRPRIVRDLAITAAEAEMAGLQVLQPAQSPLTAEERRQRAAKYARIYRERRGCRPHRRSAEQTKPWDAQGISRTEFYNRRKAQKLAQAAIRRRRVAFPSWPVGRIRHIHTWRSPTPAPLHAQDAGGYLATKCLFTASVIAGIRGPPTDSPRSKASESPRRATFAEWAKESNL